ncbi:metal-dependent hydrolase [Aromatoleum toluclasticum]|uniref:metal-dependent hydrolase n=1 Tax=Aromatoleum toluclasticum TaxID=92003 RepID=UPI000A077725|nr:metal-dependent hydrolase [Aromatoleum toluclasticum]
MLIGHLPAGYIISRLLIRYAEPTEVSAKAFILAGVIGAVAPDLDMFYFHLVDHRQHHHHTYFTHYPVVWLVLLTASSAWLFTASKKNYAACASIFSLNGFVHMILDTIVGDIWWFAPWGSEPFAFFTVPALYKPWWLNFLLHWSFAIEIAVVVWAIYLWRKARHHKITVTATNAPTVP